MVLLTHPSVYDFLTRNLLEHISIFADELEVGIVLFMGLLPTPERITVCGQVRTQLSATTNFKPAKKCAIFLLKQLQFIT